MIKTTIFKIVSHSAFLFSLLDLCWWCRTKFIKQRNTFEAAQQNIQLLGQYSKVLYFGFQNEFHSQSDTIIPIYIVLFRIFWYSPFWNRCGILIAIRLNRFVATIITSWRQTKLINSMTSNTVEVDRGHRRNWHYFSTWQLNLLKSKLVWKW